MRIKKFIADSAKEALIQVRQELGPQAVILKTQTVQSKSLLGFLGKNQVEVTAALDENLYAKPQASPPKENLSEAASGLQLYNRKGQPKAPPKKDAPAGSSSRLTDEKFRLAEIHEDVEEVKSVLRGLAEHLRHQNLPTLPEKVSDICFRLMDNQVDQQWAVRTALKLQGQLSESDVTDSDKVTDKATELLAASVHSSGPFELKSGRATRVMLVGPTGAGKTTTLAKLAAQYGILQRMRVRIITADTYRIAAAEQLKTFAEIADIPMQVVFSPEEMRQAITKMLPTADLILIDTAGRSQHHEEHMQDLKALVDVVEPDELHLVLSATTKQSDLMDAADRYRLLGVNRFLFTKLDETKKYGELFNLLAESKMPFSYVTNGQSVPDDIEEAKASRLAQLLLTSEKATGSSAA